MINKFTQETDNYRIFSSVAHIFLKACINICHRIVFH